MIKIEEVTPSGISLPIKWHHAINLVSVSSIEFITDRTAPIKLGQT